MKVFWSWQNDVTPKVNRHFIRDALAEAVEHAGDELGLEDAERPALDHDTKDTSGMAEITATILDKISRSAVFVADLTPISETPDGKALPNPNVLIELGWALSELGSDRIIAVLNTASGWKPDDLPFDIRHRRAMTYHLAETADKKARETSKKKLVRDLTAALRTNLGQYAEEQAASKDIKCVPAKPDDPSIWASASDTLEHNDSFGRDHKDTIALPQCPRGYIRIIPAGWKNSRPTINDIAGLGDRGALWPPADWAHTGSFGVCEEGFVRYWFTGKAAKGEDETRNVAMFFDETGEFWILHGTAISVGKKGSTLNVQSLVRGWWRAMETAFAIFMHFGAHPTWKVKAGLSGVRDVRWPGQWEIERPPARKNGFVLERQQREWGEEAQLEFLTDGYNAVRDLFGLPRATRDDTRKLIQR
jgi:hypothetical protein